MGLLTETVEIKINNRTYKHFEDLGYEIPRHYNCKKKKWLITTGATITVKVSDLYKGSGVEVECECDCCHKIYTMQYGKYLQHNLTKGFFCRSCSHKFIMSGKDHPNWNDNLTDEDRIIGRNYPEYKNFIKRVLIRDEYTCCYCGNSDHNNVAVHHLNGYDWYIEGRTQDENAVCLCKECHSNFHAHYGMGGNTKEQFEEWLGKPIENINRYNGKISSAREVVCLEDNKVHKSCLDASRFYHIDARQVNFCCNKKPSYLSVQGLHFMWLDDYEKLSKEEIELYLLVSKPKNWKSIICITTNKIFDNASKASRFYNMKRGNDKILKVCKGERKCAGKDPLTGEKLVWRFYNQITHEVMEVSA